MPREREADRLKTWRSRVVSGNKAYGKWDQKWSCSLLEQYYYGEQWQGESEEWAKRKYVINLFYPTVNVRKPSLLFFRPKIRVTPRPGRGDDAGTSIELRAKLQQDTVNTFIGMPDLGFDEETALAVLDAHFRFGVVEVGYTADFIDNPNADKPILKENSNDPLLDAEGNQVTEPKRLIGNERLFVKWIPAKQFRVSVNASNRKVDWLGYYEWHYVEDIKRNKQYRNTSDLKADGKLSKDFNEPGTEDDAENRKGMLRLWKIWDLRTHTRLTFCTSGDGFLQEKKFKFHPFAILRFDDILDSWYPLPPAFNWVHPQNELNETREMQRVHRRRFVRRYQMVDGSMTEEELAKLEEPYDGLIVRVNRENAVTPIADSPLDAAVVRNIPLSKDDFREISGVTGEERGIADADTATQANILDTRSRIRESYGRVQVAKWLSDVGRLILMTIRDSMALSFWIQMSVDPLGENAEAETQAVAAVWQQITSEDLGDINFDISVDIESLSPVAEEAERNSWNQVLALVTNPQLQALLAASDVLLRKTLGFYGVKSEREIREIKRAIQAAVAMQAAALAAKSGGAGLPGITPAAPGPTPTNDAIFQQITRQIGIQ